MKLYIRNKTKINNYKRSLLKVANAVKNSIKQRATL